MFRDEPGVSVGMRCVMATLVELQELAIKWGYRYEATVRCDPDGAVRIVGTKVTKREELPDCWSSP